jgi:hypothetical protein
LLCFNFHGAVYNNIRVPEEVTQTGAGLRHNPQSLGEKMIPTDSHPENTKGCSQVLPVPGNWYVDKSGALFKVKALVFESGHPDHVIIDYPRGVRRKIGFNQWRRFIYQVTSAIQSHQSQP